MSLLFVKQGDGYLNSSKFFKDCKLKSVNTVIPRYIALHLLRLRGIFYSAFFTVNPDWLRGFTVV